MSEGKEVVRQMTISVVGHSEGKDGKQELLKSLINGRQPNTIGKDFMPTKFEEFTVPYDLKTGKVVLPPSSDCTLLITMRDSYTGKGKTDSLRPLSYPGSHCVFVVISVIREPGFGYSSTQEEMIEWMNELRTHLSGVPVIFIGTGVADRGNEEIEKKLKEKGFSFITKEQGEKWAKAAGAVTYLEINAEKFRVEDWNYIFNIAYRNGRLYKESKLTPSGGCSIM